MARRCLKQKGCVKSQGLAPFADHQAMARQISLPGNGASLSEREKEVLRWISRGKSTWDISEVLGITERTVKFHVCNILEKLDCINRAHAVAIAMEQGLIDAGSPVLLDS